MPRLQGPRLLPVRVEIGPIRDRLNRQGLDRCPGWCWEQFIKLKPPEFHGRGGPERHSPNPTSHNIPIVADILAASKGAPPTRPGAQTENNAQAEAKQ